MISDPVELEELRKTTADMISENRWSIALIRSSWERTPSGGIRPVNPELLPAKERFFASVQTDPVIVQLSEGEQVRADYVLVGLHDDDIQEKDTFAIGNQKFKVVEVHPDRSFETRAWVVEYS